MASLSSLACSLLPPDVCEEATSFWEMTRDYPRLPEIARDCPRLPEITPRVRGGGELLGASQLSWVTGCEQRGLGGLGDELLGVEPVSRA